MCSYLSFGKIVNPGEDTDGRHLWYSFTRWSHMMCLLSNYEINKKQYKIQFLVTHPHESFLASPTVPGGFDQMRWVRQEKNVPTLFSIRVKDFVNFF